MKEFELARRAGVTKKSLRLALKQGFSEQEIFEFLHGDLNALFEKLPKPSRYQGWDTSGKRYVHLEDARFAAKHFLRNGIHPSSNKALVLSGTEPALACLPWAMSGIASDFTACEKVFKNFNRAKSREEDDIKKVYHRLPKKYEVNVNLLWCDCLDLDEETYGIFDLDFCSNQLRSPSSRSKITGLLARTAPRIGPFVLRTTLHVGRLNNSQKDVENHIESFEKNLREGSEEYKIRGFNRSPYQSSLPMISLIWILERKYQELEYNQQPDQSGQGEL